MRRVAAAALLAAGCAPGPAGGGDAGAPDAAGARPADTVAHATSADAGTGTGTGADPVAAALERAPILEVRAGADGRALLEARLSLEGGPRWVALAPAELQRPLAYRRPLAYYRLARAVGARVVPATALRRIGLGEMAGLLAGQPGAEELLRQLAVLHDGTVDALVTAPAPGPPGPAWDAAAARRVITFDEAPEIELWGRWAASPGPLPDERTSLLRDHLEALMLDYLAGHALRRAISVDDAAGALVLADNAGAFPPRAPERSLDRFLRRLAAASRFPRSLRDGLARLGRAEATAALAPGARPFAGSGRPAPATGFELWLLPPRAHVDLDDRRATLLSLIEAKIAARGEAAVLSL
ncbi:MAG: hypothetical protein IT372_26410 [Polyangiaceae bacterium]|nr:hypothetical protein [Polyangiaceae bacterium]